MDTRIKELMKIKHLLDWIDRLTGGKMQTGQPEEEEAQVE
jgi:hypothetical protein